MCSIYNVARKLSSHSSLGLRAQKVGHQLCRVSRLCFWNIACRSAYTISEDSLKGTEVPFSVFVYVYRMGQKSLDTQCLASERLPLLILEISVLYYVQDRKWKRWLILNECQEKKKDGMSFLKFGDYNLTT